MGDSELKRKTARGLLWGVIGNGGVQLLSLLFGIFLSRMLLPTDYGLVGALTIFIALGGMLSESGFTLALVNKRNVDNDDFSSVFWFNLVVGCICYAILFLVSPLVAQFYSKPEMTSLLRFLSLGVLVSPTATAPNAKLFRALKVKERSRAQIGAMAVSGIAGLGCAFAGLGYWALAIQNVLYLTVNAMLLWTQAKWHPTPKYEFGRIRAMLPFSMKQLAVAFFNNLNANFFPVLLGKFYGMWPTGCYTQGSKWTTMGSNTIKGMVESVGQPVLREASDSAERLERIFGKMLSFTAFVCFPCMFGLALVSHELIVITITDKWLECVPIMQILCLWGAFVPIVSLYGNLFNSNNRPGIYMWNTILPGLLQTLVLLVTFRYSIHVMLVAYVCINIAWLAVWQAQARRLLGIRTRLALSSTLPYLVMAAMAMIAAATAALFVSSLWLSLLIKIAAASAAYLLAAWLFSPTLLKETAHYLRHRK